MEDLFDFDRESGMPTEETPIDAPASAAEQSVQHPEVPASVTEQPAQQHVQRNPMHPNRPWSRQLPPILSI